MMSLILLFFKNNWKGVILILFVLGTMGYVKYLKVEVATKSKEIETIQLQLTKANSELEDLHQKSEIKKEEVKVAEKAVIEVKKNTDKQVEIIKKQIISPVCEQAIKFSIDNKKDLDWNE